MCTSCQFSPSTVIFLAPLWLTKIADFSRGPHPGKWPVVRSPYFSDPLRSVTFCGGVSIRWEPSDPVHFHRQDLLLPRGCTACTGQPPNWTVLSQSAKRVCTSFQKQGELSYSIWIFRSHLVLEKKDELHCKGWLALADWSLWYSRDLFFSFSSTAADLYDRVISLSCCRGTNNSSAVNESVQIHSLWKRKLIRHHLPQFSLFIP